MSTWYLNRLKTMSFHEILFRIKQFFQKQKEFLFYKHFIPYSALLSCNERIVNTDFVSFNLFPEIISVFGKEFKYLENEIDWHKDIYSGESFPAIFSKKINIRFNSGASAKNVWEINRLQFLTHIVINYRISGREFYIIKFKEILSSWIDQNPYLQGINWYSNIEVNIRLISWFFCWQILDVEDLAIKNKQFRDFVETKWIPSIYHHCYYSYHNPSRFSSANNHLISEYAGLFIACSLWKFKESEKWLRYTSKGLEKEIKKQHSKGINKEETSQYIQFVTDFFLLSYVIGEKTNLPFSEDYRKHLNEIFTYIFVLLDCKSNFPKYGDEDDGKCINLFNDNNFNNFKSLMTSGSVIFKDQVFKSKSNGFDLKNRILFGEEGKLTYNLIPDILPVENSKFFKDEGHFIFRKQENNMEIYLHFDAAPLGYLSIAAHGHADALSFILHVDGQPVIVDPGTYTYNTQPEWRKFFIGTLAHNTLRINKQNQATIGGPALWLRHYKIKILESVSTEENDNVVAEHNGYNKSGITHKREINFDKNSLIFKITDTIETKSDKVYAIEMPFHFHPSIKVTYMDNNSYLLINPIGRNVNITLDSKLNINIVRGQTDPELLGWYSGSFLQKEPSDTLLCSAETSGNAIFETIISINKL
jgi:hypothetical protein